MRVFYLFMNKMNKNSFGLAQIPLMIMLLVLAIAVPFATELVQQNADNRNQAAVASCAGTNTASACKGLNNGDPCKGFDNEGYGATCKLTKGAEKAGCGCIKNSIPTPKPSASTTSGAGINLSSDPKNCGMLGNICNSGKCVIGSCSAVEIGSPCNVTPGNVVCGTAGNAICTCGSSGCVWVTTTRSCIPTGTVNNPTATPIPIHNEGCSPGGALACVGLTHLKCECVSGVCTWQPNTSAGPNFADPNYTGCPTSAPVPTIDVANWLNYEECRQAGYAQFPNNSPNLTQAKRVEDACAAAFPQTTTGVSSCTPAKVKECANDGNKLCSLKRTVVNGGFEISAICVENTTNYVDDCPNNGKCATAGPAECTRLSGKGGDCNMLSGIVGNCCVPKSYFGGGNSGGNNGVSPIAKATLVPTSEPKAGGSCNQVCKAGITTLKDCKTRDADGTSRDSICRVAGRIEACGDKTFCCPTNNGLWSTDMTKCSEVPVPVGESPILNYKVAFGGVNPTAAQCMVDWPLQFIVLAAGESKVYSNVIAPTKTVVGNKLQFSGSLILTGFTKTSGIAVFIKGPKHLQVKYGINNQTGPYNQAGGEITLTTVYATSPIYDFVGYPITPGDVVGNGPDEPQNGWINGADFAYVKSKSLIHETIATGGYLKGDLDGNCQVNSNDVNLLKISLQEKQGQLY